MNPELSPELPTNLRKLRIVFVGHVDHGKSTLIGRIFHDTNSLPIGKAEQIRAACEAEGMEFEYAFLLDALLEEQAQNITIDTTQIPFKTARRPYVIIDAPGHKEFLKNMISGAAGADAAILLIDAAEGMQEQSRRHGYLLSLLGIRQIIVAVNKMDLVDFSQKRFAAVEQECRDFLAQFGVTPVFVIPIAARHGENIVTSSPKMPWSHSPSILSALDSFDLPPDRSELPLRLPLQAIYRFDHRRILAGRIESGTLRVGDRLLFSPGGKTSSVATIERWNTPEQHSAEAGQSIGITLTEQIFVERGQVASLEQNAPITANTLRARLFWMGRSRLETGRPYRIKLATSEVDGEILSIDRVIDASSLDAPQEKRTYIERNDVAEVTIRTRAPLVFDNYDRDPALGRLVIMDGRQVGGGGIIFGGHYQTPDEIRSANIYRTEGKITPAQRAARNGHHGAVLWFTGLSGSGKSTITQALEHELFRRGMHTTLLDGDNVRHGLCSDLAFSPADRAENIRRVAHAARLMAESGLIVLASLISPYRADRDKARQIITETTPDFFEIHLSAPLATCEARDPKGLYRKARAGEITGFTGLDAPYEAPEAPELDLPTHQLPVEESIARLLALLLPRITDTPADFDI